MLASPPAGWAGWGDPLTTTTSSAAAARNLSFDLLPPLMLPPNAEMGCGVLHPTPTLTLPLEGGGNHLARDQPIPGAAQ